MKKIFIIIVFKIIFLFLNGTNSWQVENCSLENVVFSMDFPPANVKNLNFSENFTTIELDASTGARALDGTNYKFYLVPGRDEGKSKFFLYFQGGAFCGSDGKPVLESCSSQSKTKFGTSNSSYWGANGTVMEETNPWGSMSSMEEYNPLFWKWTKIRLLPLDGANYQGYFEEPIAYNGTNLWFRGYNNTMASIEYMIKNYGLFNATEIIISGGSSGGIAAMMWASYLRDYFPRHIKISIVIDGGLFLDAYSVASHCYLFRFMKQSLVLALNLSTTTDLYKNCRYRDDEVWKCLLAEYIYEDLEYNAFISNTQTDFYEMTNMMGITCILEGGPEYCNDTERDRITKVREDFLKVALEMKKNKPDWGFWLRSCFEHSLQYSWAWYGETMNVFNAETQQAKNIPGALYDWYLGKTTYNTYIDLVDWLHNPNCMYYYE